MQFGRSVVRSRHDFTAAFSNSLPTPSASDMERQHLKFMDMIAAIVGALDERELFQSIISHMGRQHARFGVKPSHFVAFGDALIWSLEHQFGPAFTSEVREAWIALYNAVRSEMLRAGQHAA
jgi:hemoglobin-like flavoprotein